VIALLGVEMVKSLRRLRTYVAFAIVVGIPVIMTIAIHANPPSPPTAGGDSGRGGGLFYLATRTGLVMPATALRLMSGFLLVIVVAVFGGDAIAGEASWGNLRYLLMRPIGRGRLVATKFTVAVACAWIATLLVVLAGLVAGIIAFGFHGLDVPFQSSLSQSTTELLAHLGIATVYVAWSLTGVVAFSFLVSCITDAPAGAIFAGVGLYITSSILDAIDSVPSGIRNILPTHYFDSWVDMFTRNQVSSDMTKGALLQLAYVAVFVAVALWWFRRKDILS
jgi:ABC-2 type transport system permease protein